MKTRIFIYILLLSLASCSQENSEKNGSKTNIKTSFEFIEITFDKGPKGITSIYIDTTKMVRVRYSDKTKLVKYFKEQIPDNKITELNQYASKAINEKVDSIALSPSEYTISYSLIIRQSGKTLKTFVYEDKDYPYYKFRDLTEYLFILGQNIKKTQTDTNFTFMTYHIICNPPITTIDTTKFRPPVIKKQ